MPPHKSAWKRPWSMWFTDLLLIHPDCIVSLWHFGGLPVAKSPHIRCARCSFSPIPSLLSHCSRPCPPSCHCVLSVFYSPSVSFVCSVCVAWIIISSWYSPWIGRSPIQSNPSFKFWWWKSKNKKFLHVPRHLISKHFIRSGRNEERRGPPQPRVKTKPNRKSNTVELSQEICSKRSRHVLSDSRNLSK